VKDKTSTRNRIKSTDITIPTAIAFVTAFHKRRRTGLKKERKKERKKEEIKYFLK
jgi:hypothetical protein